LSPNTDLDVTDSNLEDVLDRLRCDGALESSGQLTLDPRRAAQRYAAFLEQEPTLGALKMIQAGVALGAAQIEVKPPGVGWRVSFASPQLRPEILLALSQPSLAETLTAAELRAWLHIQGAWLLAVASGDPRVELKIRCPSHRLLWTMADGSFTQQLVDDSSTRPGWARLTVEGRPSSWWSSTVDHAREIAKRCALCPVPIKLEKGLLQPAPLTGLPQYPFAPMLRDAADRWATVRSYFSTHRIRLASRKFGHEGFKC
jgi:hypothetical protein